MADPIAGPQADETTTPDAPPAGDAPAGTGSPLLGGSALADTLADEPAQPTARRVREALPPDRHGWWWGVGRRKSAVARVRMRPSRDGGGEVRVQVSRKRLKAVDEYFTEERDRKDVYAPLEATGTRGRFEIVIRANGGGYMGQAQAVRLGIARALRDYDPSLEDALRDAGYLSRDARRVERKKYGQPGARRRFQFSKR